MNILCTRMMKLLLLLLTLLLVTSDGRNHLQRTQLVNTRPKTMPTGTASRQRTRWRITVSCSNHLTAQMSSKTRLAAAITRRSRIRSRKRLHGSTATKKPTRQSLNPSKKSLRRLPYQSCKKFLGMQEVKCQWVASPTWADKHP